MLIGRAATAGAMLWLFAGSAAAVSLESPNGQVVGTIATDAAGRLSFAVRWEGETIVARSPLGVIIDGCDLGDGVTLGTPERYTIDERYAARGVHATARNHARGLRIPVTHQGSGTSWTLECRAYDEGFALRYLVPGTGERTIQGEVTRFTLPAGATCWYFERPNDWKLKTYAGLWQSTAIENLATVSPTGPVQGPPLVVELPRQLGYAAITEAALFNYSGMRLEAVGDRTLRANFTEPDGFALDGDVRTPWRVVMLAGGLDALVNNDLLTHLCPPPDPKLFADPSYIAPGRSVWRWWARDTGTPEQEKAYIDAANRLGFEYTTIDEGWKDWPDPFDTLAQVCRHAAEHQVGVFVWSHWRDVNDPADDYAELAAFLTKVADAGARGVKIDFMNGESLACVRFNEAVLRHAAARRLMVNFHGCGKPTGESRTYPNEVTREAIRGLELNRMDKPLPASHNAALPFTRFILGHADYTPLTVTPERLGATTVAHQLATWIAFTSPLQVLAEDPQRLLDAAAYAPIVDVLQSAPTVWDETRVLAGSVIGELAVLARRSGDDWYVAGVNGDAAREYPLAFDFLDQPAWTMTLIRDGSKPVELRTDTLDVQRGDTVPIALSAGGGFVAHLTPDRQQTAAWKFVRTDDGLELRTADYTLAIAKKAFRMTLTPADGGEPIAAHPDCGLEVLGAPVERVTDVEREAHAVRLTVYTTAGEHAVVTLRPAPHALTLDVETPWPGQSAVRFAALAPAYGLGDHGGQQATANLAGLAFRGMHNDGGPHRCRFFAPFVVFPKQRFAAVNFCPQLVSVDLGADGFRMETLQATRARYTYFVGELTEVYAAYRAARDAEGYPGIPPKFRLFELGWESWDALRWDTNQRTVTDILTRFAEHDYPIRWAVTGSGFWPAGGTTTSFGAWHAEKYPDVTGMRDWLHARDIAWMIGLRTNFVVEGGPFTAEGLARDAFARNPDGSLMVRKSGAFPKADCYMLDSTKPGAADWYADLYERWGVDGVKEDTMMQLPVADLYNGAMWELAQRGVLVMARNAAYTSPGTLQRMEDMVRIDTITARMPITWLQYAASAAPNVYCDAIGFGGMQDNPRGAIRHAWFSALTAGMAVGAEPWHWPDEHQRTLRKAIDFHLALTPYLYSAAWDSYATGYPYTMTPLPIAFPGDSNTYNLASNATQQFQWIIGPSLLAAPLLHNNYKRTSLMNIYLPEGRWILFDVGEVFEGPQTLTDFAMPLDQAPVFVGGAGILLLRDPKDDHLYAEVYSVSKEDQKAAFYLKGGENAIVIENRLKGTGITTAFVRDATNGTTIPHRLDEKRKAVVFMPEENRSYTVFCN